MLIRFFLLFFLFVNISFAEEAILNYKVDIYIKKDSSLKVIEKIKVKAERNKIKRGIYRDFPIRYKRADGTYYTTGFEIKSVKRDGLPEKYKIVRNPNYVRVYIGDKDQILEPNIYQYKIVFKTNRQIGYFENHDELYFNAIGDGWDFKIKKAEVNVFLPKGVRKDSIRLKAFTGKRGSIETNYESGFNGSKEVFFYLTKPLNPKEAFTIVVSFPKGLVKELSKTENYKLWFQDNLYLLLAGLSSIFGFFTHFYFWLRFGKDPKGKTIYPLFTPPEEIEAYAMPYLKSMREHTRSLPSLIASIAIKGHIKISETEGSFLTKPTIFLHKLEGDLTNLSSLEALVFKQLFLNETVIECKPSNHTKFKLVKKYLKSFLKNNYGKYFNLNKTKVLPGFIFQFLAFLILLILGYEVLIVPLFFVNTIIFSFFLIFMKSYTKKGRELLDKVEGYEEYLKTAEKGRFKRVHGGDFNEAYFEKHLPFAIALGCESKWLKAFENELSKVGRDINSYNPPYFSSSSSFANSKAFSSENFANAVNYSSVPPGSRSGFSGGSSGGGGGGGGGGGW